MRWWNSSFLRLTHWMQREKQAELLAGIFCFSTWFCRGSMCICICIYINICICILFEGRNFLILTRLEFVGRVLCNTQFVLCISEFKKIISETYICVSFSGTGKLREFSSYGFQDLRSFSTSAIGASTEPSQNICFNHQ